MSRWASWRSSAIQRITDIPGVQHGRLILLLAVSVILTFSLATGNVTADRLFQSPQSPPVQSPDADSGVSPEENPPVAGQEQPPQPAAGQETSPQPVEEAAPPVPRPVERDRPGRAEPSTGETERSGPRNFILDRIELIDSAIVSGAYIWACCGIGALLLAPILLLVLEIRGRSKLRQHQDDNF